MKIEDGFNGRGEGTGSLGNETAVRPKTGSLHFARSRAGRMVLDSMDNEETQIRLLENFRPPSSWFEMRETKESEEGVSSAQSLKAKEMTDADISSRVVS